MERILIISFSSVKGGVGKTTSCVNLAYALASLPHAKKVLLVDFDSQGGATHHLSEKFHKHFQASLYDVLHGKCNIHHAIHSYTENLHLIPISFQFHEIASTDFEKPLRKALAPILKEYDFLFFDLSPSIYPGSTIPILLSNYVIIPVDCPGGLSLLGLQNAAQIVYQIKATKNHNIDVLGILPCFVDHTKVCREMLAHLNKTYPADILPSIRRNASLSQASSIGQTIFEYKRNSTGAKDYAELAREFLQRVKKT